jgi:ankyrin repeat protein
MSMKILMVLATQHFTLPAIMTSVFLANPQINVNQSNKFGSTPFLRGCNNGKVDIVKILLRDIVWTLTWLIMMMNVLHCGGHLVGDMLK